MSVRVSVGATEMLIGACPFCGAEMERIRAFSSRLVAVYGHPAEGYCVIQSVMLSVSEQADDLERLAKWNRRVTA